MTQGTGTPLRPAHEGAQIGAHELAPGLYEAPITRTLRRKLDRLHDSGGRSDTRKLEGHDAAYLLARHLYDRFLHALLSAHGKDRVQQQVDLTNGILSLLEERAAASGASCEDGLDEPFEELREVLDSLAVGLGEDRGTVRPAVPLSTSELLVNSRHDLSLGPEIRRELASADRVDLLCSFLKWSGFRLVEPALRELLERRPNGLRVLTTAYMGVTERRALDELSRMGAQVAISFDTRRTRLHAKAWLFHRDSGFSTAFVGSSNLSAAAMLDGLEWNVRLSQRDNEAILRKFATTFEQYWCDSAFREYDPERDAALFDDVVRDQKRAHDRVLAAIRIYPQPHQEEILAELEAERERGHRRNLVVAATGTGKTIVAALDYKRLRNRARRGEALVGQVEGAAWVETGHEPTRVARVAEARQGAWEESTGRGDGPDPTLLFVAHRREILEQSLTAFRLVLGDPTFGELLVGGEVPVRGRHVFASIQSLSEKRLAELDPEAYDVVIVDEFHHAAAPTYDRLLCRIRPKILLGLTATPERADGKSILGWFDGRIASELRLWKALDQGLLSPFQYFGVSDGTDLRKVKWTPKGYDSDELRKVYTGGHHWARLVLGVVERKVADIGKMRALGFCVDVAHARFMAERFREAGIDSVAVTADTPREDRDDALRRLQDGRIRVLFCVDLFNEGVDVPDIDTVLFLRPTESATVFLQQLGRGLRHADGKECLTAIDFIGHAHKRFRFDVRFRAILGGTRRQIERHVERGFPLLPSGCSIQLEKQAQDEVLENIRASLGLGYRALAEDLASLGPETTLAQFLEETGTELEDVYDQPGRCWTALREQAGFHDGPAASRRDTFCRALSRMLHLDDFARLDALAELVGRETAPVGDPESWVQRDLFVLLGLVREPLRAMGEVWRDLWADAAILGELRELLALLADRVRKVTYPLTGRLARVPLQAHATYSLDEVMAAIDERDRKGSVRRLREGVYWSERFRADLLFVTLEKSERDYSPTTMYRDYPISPTLFHWESQSGTHEGTKIGRRYVRHEEEGSSVVLFVRQAKKDARGVTTPYLCLGEARYVRHEGGKPMQVVWELSRGMPVGVYQEVKVAAG